MICARCQAELLAGARFCAACGAAAGSACAHCGAPVLAGQRFCTGCGNDVAAVAVSAPMAADEGERRQATVMFSDLSGYTALNQAFDPEDVEAAMAPIKSAASTVIER